MDPDAVDHEDAVTGRSGVAEASTHSRSVSLPDGDLTLTWAAVTHTGRRRDSNQDAVLAAYPLFIVADGMGGHIGGEIASASTVDRLRGLVDGHVSTKAIEKALARAVKDIASHPETTDDGTGTTVTGVFLDASQHVPHWVTLNIGDSRVYLVRDGVIDQITTDHSVVQELVAAGRLSPEEAENHPYGNVITRAVGPSDGVTPDYVRLDVVDGDRFVICSDGLTKELTDYGIQHFLAENADPADAVTAMLEAALENGGRDNVTIIVLDVAREGESGEPAEATEETAPAERTATEPLDASSTDEV
ncbi:protein phosphatase 2C domain-containing protein [Microbacterium aoyamense]|uniref:Protein phosphatase 2C domain-containing protein n=1 Tax=Microbacterium aoyamense TaxID=344166 RepID=A0ABP5B757_9MICO|nr:protein phosphatase 2C domain-containing protein [Microbacterium aoyamense]